MNRTKRIRKEIYSVCPDTTNLYVLLNENSEVVYIGQTDRAVSERLKEHKQNGFKSRNITIKQIGTVSKPFANRLEAGLIKELSNICKLENKTFNHPSDTSYSNNDNDNNLKDLKESFKNLELTFKRLDKRLDDLEFKYLDFQLLDLKKYPLVNNIIEDVEWQRRELESLSKELTEHKWNNRSKGPIEPNSATLSESELKLLNELEKLTDYLTFIEDDEKIFDNYAINEYHECQKRLSYER